MSKAPDTGVPAALERLQMRAMLEAKGEREGRVYFQAGF